MPNRSRGAMHAACSSWNNSLHANGSATRWMGVPGVQVWHVGSGGSARVPSVVSPEAISPHDEQTYA